MKNTVLTLSATIFALVSVAHFARFFLKADLSIFGYQLPLLASLLAGTLTAVLAILLARLRN